MRGGWGRNRLSRDVLLAAAGGTEAQSCTFAEVEIGIEPTAVQYRLLFGAMGKRYLRRLVEQAIDGLRTRLQHGN